MQSHLAIVLAFGGMGFAFGYCVRALISRRRRRLAREQRQLGLDG